VKVHACTLMWGTAWERYGHKFAETFHYWDESIDLTLVADRNVPFNRPRIAKLQEIPGYDKFVKDFELEPVRANVPEHLKVSLLIM